MQITMAVGLISIVEKQHPFIYLSQKLTTSLLELYPAKGVLSPSRNGVRLVFFMLAFKHSAAKGEFSRAFAYLV